MNQVVGIFWVAVLYFFPTGRTSTLVSTSMELCGSETDIELSKSGETSSMTVTLSPLLENANFCKLRVTAPKTHVINMHFVENDVHDLRASIFNNSEKHPPCMMSIILPDNPRTPIWKGDLCSASPLPEIDLLTADFKILWTPPSNPKLIKNRKIILTAVGQGTICKESGQHTCMRIGWIPVLCISDHLVCDGIHNCPKSSSSSDEDEKFCKSRSLAQASLEQLAMEIFKKFKQPSDIVNNNWLHDKLSGRQSSLSGPSTKKSILNWKNWQELKKTETTTMKGVIEDKPKMTDSISQVLSKYGPWGYLMLGMLICGTVLMFCGLWECCFRKPKSTVDGSNPQNPPTTVLIINPQDEVINISPPNYEDLDQPPSYTTLFPNLKEQSGSLGNNIESGDMSENSNINNVNSITDDGNIVDNNSNNNNLVQNEDVVRNVDET